MLFFHREVESLLRAINLTSDVIASGFGQKKCNKSCLEHFQKGICCEHDFAFCIICQDVWYKPIHPLCPRHENQHQQTFINSLNYFPSNTTFTPFDTTNFEKREVTATSPYDSFDILCDDVCEYSFEKLKYSECRHQKRKCHNCKGVFERLLLCSCFLKDFTVHFAN